MPETPFTIRVRTKTGLVRITSLSETSCIVDLKTAISAQASLGFSHIKILKGYPPKQIDFSNESSTLASHSIANGELLTIEEDLSKSSIVSTSTVLSQNSVSEGVLLRKVVPANNSCLFTSVHFVMENGDYDLDCQESMRQFIAQTVKSDLITFNEAILGKSNSEYCKWILVVNYTVLIFQIFFLINCNTIIIFNSLLAGAAQ